MSKNSNGYIFFFASVVTLISGVALAVAATVLKPMQEKNKALEKKEFILNAIGYTDEDFTNKQAIEETYDQYIQERVVDKQGNIIEGVNAFEIVPINEQKQENNKPDYKAKLPLYVYDGPKGNVFVLPVTGKGLWGPIFGYVAVDKQFHFVEGVIFDHDKETPGLGAEITASWFQEQFVGKRIRDNENNLYSIKVLKGQGNELDEYSVDGISGATITARGVMEMLEKDFEKYQGYFNKINS